MPLTIDQIEDEALSLPEANRWRLVTSLLDSLPTPDTIFDEESPEFEVELARRSAEVEVGTAKLVPHEAVMREMRELLDRG